MNVETVPPAALFHRDRHRFRRPATNRPYRMGWMHRIRKDHRFIAGKVVELVENAVELDDEAMEAYLVGAEPSEEVLKKCIRKAVLGGVFYPILAGSAFKNKGVQPLLDAVVDYLPSPVDIPPTVGIDFKTEEPVTREASDEAPLSVLAF